VRGTIGAALARECRLMPHVDPNAIRAVVVHGTATALAELMGLRNGEVGDAEAFLRYAIEADGVIQDPRTGEDREIGPSRLGELAQSIQEHYQQEEVAERDPYAPFAHLGNPQEFAENGTAPDDPQGYAARRAADAERIAGEVRSQDAAMGYRPERSDADREDSNAALESEMWEQDRALSSYDEDDMEQILSAESENIALYGDAGTE
jgi:hypothetical protein